MARCAVLDAVLGRPIDVAIGRRASEEDISLDSTHGGRRVRQHRDRTVRGTGRTVYAMTYFDDSATNACHGNPARISGPGFVDGDHILHVGPVVCLPRGNVFRSRFAIGYDYDADTDTLTDDFGIVWHRAS
jgi:hypothetical protein